MDREDYELIEFEMHELRDIIEHVGMLIRDSINNVASSIDALTDAIEEKN